MKKKILLVFLICCMLLGVASPAMAAEVIEKPSDIPLPTYADVLNAYDSEDYENLPFTDYDYIVYYLDYENAWYCKVLFENSSNFYLYDDSRFLVSDYTDPWDLLTILKYNNGVWSYYGVSTLGTGSITIDGVLYGNMNITSSASVAYSTKTIYYFGSDEVFMQAPLPDPGELVVELTKNQVKILALDLDGNLKILVPFGISCLVLLISLLLLLKVLRRFLG